MLGQSEVLGYSTGVVVVGWILLLGAFALVLYAIRLLFRLLRRPFRGSPSSGLGASYEELVRQNARGAPPRWWQRSTPAWLWFGLLACGLLFFVNAPDGTSWGNWAFFVGAAAVVGLLFGRRWYRQVVLARSGWSSVVWVRWGRAARDESQPPPRVLLPGTASEGSPKPAPPPAAMSQVQKVDELRAKQLISDAEYHQLRDPAPVSVSPAPAAGTSDEPERKTCPDCAESVLAAARVCRYCGYRFDDAPLAN